MVPLNKFVVSSFVCLVLVRHTLCDNRDGASSQKKHDDKERHAKQHDEAELFAHKLENAPIPSVHDGPQTIRFKEVGDVARFRARRRTSQKDNLNPQKPHQKNEVPQQDSASGNDEGTSKHFHHPGHSSEVSSNLPTNANDYYKIANTYGGAFRYGSNQTFKGYTETANIGVIPPRGANTNNYYKSISNLGQYPILSQPSNGMTQSLYGNVDYPSYSYGHGGRSYAKNSYKNVLTALAMWSMFVGLVDGVRYTVYNHTHLPQDYSRNVFLSNDSIASCFKDAPLLCNGYTRPLCISNGTTFCVSSSSAMVACDGEAKGTVCANVSTPCDNCEGTRPTYLPCAVNVTVLAGTLDKEKFNSTLGFSNGSHDKDVVLCVTTLVVPQKQLNRPICGGKSACLEVTPENSIGNIVESAPSSKERK